jgi:hypothetical protein
LATQALRDSLGTQSRGKLRRDLEPYKFRAVATLDQELQSPRLFAYTNKQQGADLILTRASGEFRSDPRG